MYTKDFYDIVKTEIDAILLDFKDNSNLKKFKTNEGKQSFGFLLWFLKRYYPLGQNYEQYITEGDDDNSCDIIFDNIDNYGKNIYYVVQAKWFSIKNISTTNGMSKEVKACISDFETILSGRKTPSKVNLNFNEKYEELLKHKKGNGQIKFVFVALCIASEKANDNIDNFISDLVGFEIMDIFRLKRDYIELEFKGAKTHNPLETPYEPKGEILLDVVEKNFICIKTPYPAYIFLVRPKLIYELFEKYGYALFYKNIRNPLFESIFNENIIDTIEHEPLKFWYFNNGITGITDNIHHFYNDANTIKIQGLQIINGAQTVHSVHKAFKDLDDSKKELMNNDALITFRILKTGGRNFDLDVTRYTNSQNPVTERDFHSNDDVQIRLQNQFYDNTNIWYERRSSEFRIKAKNIVVVSNEKFAQTYLAYQLQNPVGAKNDVQYFFVEDDDNIQKPSLYKKIFNKNTKYDVMQVSYYLYQLIERKKKDKNKELSKVENKKNAKYTKRDLGILQYQFVKHASLHILALMKLQYEKKAKDNLKSINSHIISDYINDRDTNFEQNYKFIVEKIKKYIYKIQKVDLSFSLSKYFKSSTSYEDLKDLVFKKIK